jgi:glucose-1-phosphate cytidylyltransferase
MKVVILAGGYGTRLSEETETRPKPMVEIGGKPILWHIMKIYSYYGFNEFIICCGYKGYYIKEFFHHYYLHQCDLTIDLKENTISYHNSSAEPWKITLVDTGLKTMTGGRIKRIQPYIGNETFLLTYGDGLSDVNINDLFDFHKKNKKYATVTAVQPSGRFGAIDINRDNEILSIKEKPKGDGAWINGGFFVLEPEIINYIAGDDTIWEKEALRALTKDKQFIAFKHAGYWSPIDTLRDKIELENEWATGGAKWKVWDK